MENYESIKVKGLCFVGPLGSVHPIFGHPKEERRTRNPPKVLCAKTLHDPTRSLKPLPIKICLQHSVNEVVLGMGIKKTPDPKRVRGLNIGGVPF